MEKRIKYFVKFYTPGIIVAETSRREISDPDPYKIEFPDYAYCFDILKREDVIDQTNGNEYQGKEERIGKRYYHPDSTIRTLEDIKKFSPHEKILISNMEINKWDKIIYTRWANWSQPFDEEKDLILEKSDAH